MNMNMKLIGLSLFLYTSSLYATNASEAQEEWKKIKVVQDLIQASHRLVKEITPIELMQKIDEDEEELVVIDIREPGQMRHGEIAHDNMIRIVRGYLELKVEGFIPDKNMQIIVYCCSGQRSILASRTLIEMGYKNVTSLKGGVQGWVAAGMPLGTHYGDMIMKPVDYIIPMNTTENNVSKISTKE